MFLFISMIKRNHPLLWRGTLFGVFYGIVTRTFVKLVFWELPTKRGNALPPKLTWAFPSVSLSRPCWLWQVWRKVQSKGLSTIGQEGFIALEFVRWFSAWNKCFFPLTHSESSMARWGSICWDGPRVSPLPVSHWPFSICSSSQVAHHTWSKTVWIGPKGSLIPGLIVLSWHLVVNQYSVRPIPGRSRV